MIADQYAKILELWSECRLINGPIEQLTMHRGSPAFIINQHALSRVLTFVGAHWAVRSPRQAFKEKQRWGEWQALIFLFWVINNSFCGTSRSIWCLDTSQAIKMGEKLIFSNNKHFIDNLKLFSVTNAQDKKWGRAGSSSQRCMSDKGLAFPFTLLQPYCYVDRFRVMNKSKASLLINRKKT